MESKERGRFFPVRAHQESGVETRHSGLRNGILGCWGKTGLGDGPGKSDRPLYNLLFMATLGKMELVPTAMGIH